jgi:hypothetical protein
MLEMPSAPEPRVNFEQLIAATRPQTGSRARLVLGLACVAVVVSLIAPGVMRTAHIVPPQTTNQELEREIARDQMIEAEADPTSGAPLVHLAGYSR